MQIFIIPTLQNSQFDRTAALLDATLALFDLSPASFPFDESRCKKIEQRRKQLDGQLFVDYMLSQAAIVEPTKKFPPHTEEAFRILVAEIVYSDWGYGRAGESPSLLQRRAAGVQLESSRVLLYFGWLEGHEWSQETSGSKPVKRNLQAGLKRSCLIYYLLAWWDTNAHGDYSVEQRLPSNFIELTHAFFFLDTGKSTVRLVFLWVRVRY